MSVLDGIIADEPYGGDGLGWDDFRVPEGEASGRIGSSIEATGEDVAEITANQVPNAYDAATDSAPLRVKALFWLIVAAIFAVAFGQLATFEIGS